MISELSSRIWKNERFHDDLLALREEALRIRLGLGNGRVFSQAAITELLQAATTLSASDIEQHQEAAYDIATSSFVAYRDSLSGVDEILYLTLARIGNFPAIGLVQQSDSPPISLPFTIRLESLSHRMNNSVAVTPGYELTFTDFQREVWTRLTSGDSVSLSAPTSTGKSFVLLSFLRRFVTSGTDAHAVYIVPTRALINQISTKLLAYFAQEHVTANRMVTVPLAPEQAIALAQFLS
jgi:hypothetical protein